MNKLYAGFARVNVTPMLGIGIVGYYKARIAEGVLDELEINALAVSCGDDKAVFLSLDNCFITAKITEEYKKHVSEVTGLPKEAIYMHATHTHTGPFLHRPKSGGLNFLDPNEKNSPEEEYGRFVCRKMADAAQMALDDLKLAKMGWGIGQAPNVAFIRRFRMKDGSIRTNPGVNNPEILEPIGEVDERVNVLRFDREDAETLVLVNFGNHPDTVGGNLLSGDWPTLLRHQVEKSLDNVKCIFFNGAQGDINHVNVRPTGGFLNDTFLDFDDVSRGYGHAKYIGRVVAGAVLQVYDKVKYVPVDSIRFRQRLIKVLSNMPKPEEMPEAYRINELYTAGRTDELPYTGMALTTVIAEAGRKIRLEHGPEFFEMNLIAVAIGNVALIGIPGEPFTGVGVALKETEGWDVVFPTCLTNGSEGYFPMKEAYDDGGYEAGASIFRAGVAEQIIEEGKALLGELRD